MSTEPITGLTYQEAGSRQTDALQNAELNFYGAWLNCVVLSVGDTAPPATPANGDCHIVGAAATGAWATHDNSLAVYRDGWQFYAPKDGVTVRNKGDSKDYIYDGSGPSWTVKSGGGGGGGNVVGPASSTDNHVALFDGATGELLKDGGELAAIAFTGDVGDLGGFPGGTTTFLREDGTFAAPASGGLTNFTESIDTASPNATIPVVRLFATNAATNVDVAVSPKGNGSFSLRPSSASMGKLGRYAVDLSLASYSYNWIATGDYSFSAGMGGRASGLYASTPGGYENTASGQSAFAIGESNNATGQYGSAAIGRGNTASGDTAVALGMYHTADGLYSACIGGNQAKARGIAAAFASGFWQTQRQRMFVGLYAQTSDATPTVANANSSGTSASNQLTLPNASVYGVTALVTARHASSGDCAAWEVKVAAKRGASAATTAIIGTPTSTVLGADAGAASWAVAVTADTTIGCIRFTVTGEAAKTIEWTVETYSVQTGL